MKVRVEASVIVEIDLPDDWSDSDVMFAVEDNGCPGTHGVGAAIEKAIREGHESSTCWACGDLQGENLVLSIDGRTISSRPTK